MEALRRLHKLSQEGAENPSQFDPKLYTRLPDVTATVKMCMGGQKAAETAMRFSSNPNITEFFELYDRIGARERARLTWEQVCVAAGLDPTAFVGAVLLAIQARSANVAKILTVSHHPEIVAARIKNAKTEGGWRDRNAIDSAIGYLPTSKGSTNNFIINPLQNKEVDGEDTGATEDEEDDKREEDLEHLFPSVTGLQHEIAAMRQLTAGKESD